MQFQDVQVITATVAALRWRIGEKCVWLPRSQISGKLWCTGDRGKLLIPRRVARDLHLMNDDAGRLLRLPTAFRRATRMNGVWKFLRVAPMRHCLWLWWQKVQAHGVLDRSAVDERDQDGRPWAESRQRFWTEFREGRRQAEENRSRLDH